MKIPTKAFLKSVSNVIDSILNLADTYRVNLDACKRIETDVAQCTLLPEYRTPAGVRMACRVVYGIVNRKSTADAKRNTTAAQQQLDEAGSYYGISNWKQTYTQICLAYAALWPVCRIELEAQAQADRAAPSNAMDACDRQTVKSTPSSGEPGDVAEWSKALPC